MNVRVEQLSATSARVTWDRIAFVQEITGYRVHYGRVGGSDEGSVTVAETQNSTDVMDLSTDMQYRFQVVAVAMLGDRSFTGMRSEVNSNSTLAINSTTNQGKARDCTFQPPFHINGTDASCGRDVALSVVITFLLTVILNTTTLVVIFALCCHPRTNLGK